MITRPVGGEVGRESIATADCEQKNVRVWVYSTDDGNFYEVPTVDSTAERDQVAVEVTLTKDGPAAITRLSRVYVPAVWRGEDVWDQLPFGDQDKSVPVHIEASPYGEEGWETLHYGWLRKIGSGGEGRLLKFVVDDYAKLLDSEYISKGFEANEQQFESTVVDEVRDILEDKGLDFAFENRTGLTDSENILESRRLPATAGTGKAYAGGVSETKAAIESFESDRDTLVDVMDWAAGLVDGGHWYVEYNGAVPVIVLSKNINAQWLSEEATDGADVDNSVTIRRNTALIDMNPINTYKVRGKSGTSIAGFDVPWSISNEFPIATAIHEGLYRRADFTFHEKDKEIDALTIDQAEKQAKKLLREEISGTGESSMVLNGNPYVRPWDTIASRPVCGEYVESDVPVMRFGIEGVTHSIPATGLYTTEIETSITITEDDITVTSTTGSGEGTEESADTRLSEDVLESKIGRANLP